MKNQKNDDVLELTNVVSDDVFELTEVVSVGHKNDVNANNPLPDVLAEVISDLSPSSSDPNSEDGLEPLDLNTLNNLFDEYDAEEEKDKNSTQKTLNVEELYEKEEEQEEDDSEIDLAELSNNFDDDLADTEKDDELELNLSDDDFDDIALPKVVSSSSKKANKGSKSKQEEDDDDDNLDDMMSFDELDNLLEEDFGDFSDDDFEPEPQAPVKNKKNSAQSSEKNKPQKAKSRAETPTDDTDADDIDTDDLFANDLLTDEVPTSKPKSKKQAISEDLDLEDDDFSSLSDGLDDFDILDSLDEQDDKLTDDLDDLDSAFLDDDISDDNTSDIGEDDDLDMSLILGKENELDSDNFNNLNATPPPANNLSQQAPLQQTNIDNEFVQSTNERLDKIENKLAKLVDWMEKYETDDLPKFIEDTKNIDTRINNLEEVLSSQKILNEQISLFVHMNKEKETEGKDAEIKELKQKLAKTEKRLSSLEQNIQAEVEKATARVLRDEIIPLLSEME